MAYSLPEEIQCCLLNQGTRWLLLLITNHAHTCSAKTRECVQEAFEELVQKILQNPDLYTESSSITNVVPNSTSSNSGEPSLCGCSLA